MTPSPFKNFSSFTLLCEKIAQNKARLLLLDCPIWIFGAGQFGRDVCSILISEGFTVHGFIESKSNGDKVLGLPVLAWHELQTAHTSAQLVIGIFNRGMPLDELEVLTKSAGFNDPLMPWDIYAQFGQQLGWRFWLSSPNMILDNIAAIEKTYLNLNDEESRQCLLELCAFRLGQHIEYASFNHIDHQYFNKLTLSALAGKKISYVDGGAYNGDTFFELLEQTEVSVAFLFEPDPDNFRKLTVAIKNSNTAAICLPLALADEYQMLSFNAGNGEGGAISAQGSIHIAAAALDEIVSGQHIDFIKLDVEGSEISALRGAESIIKSARPILAISLYHRPQDIWEIPLLLSGICHDYSFYIRQHYSNSFDSVLYAIPNQ